MNRRTLLKAMSAVPALAACGPTAAHSEAYTVDMFAADLRDAGANPKWFSSGVMMNVDGVDVEAKYNASRKAETAGITTRDLWEYLKPSSKFTGDGWYAHQIPLGTCTVHEIIRRECAGEEWFEVAPWPGRKWIQPVDIQIQYFTREEIEDFIHHRMEESKRP